MSPSLKMNGCNGTSHRQSGETVSGANFEKKIVVLTGGSDAERKMSLQMGDQAVAALHELGYKNVRLVDAKDNFRKVIPELCSEGTVPDVVYNAMVGGLTESGAVCGLLDCLHIPYTHSGVLATALQMDKQLSKIVVSAAGVPVTESFEFDRFDVDFEQFRDHPVIRDGPYILKPLTNGSSFGVHLFQKGELPSVELLRSSDWSFGEKVMVERFIPGREFTCAILSDKVIGMCEVIQPESAIFFKYSDGTAADWHDNIRYSGFDPEIVSKIEMYSLMAHKALGCRNLSRSDFRVTAEGDVVFLELNCLPGTVKDLSLYPPILEKNGIDYNEMVQRILEDARYDS